MLLMATGLAGTAVEADASQSSFQVETTAGDVSGAVGNSCEDQHKTGTAWIFRKIKWQL